jgi:hypothetical protein
MYFERGKDPIKSLGIGAEFYRKKKMEAVNNQLYEEAAMWRSKERIALGIDEEDDIIQEEDHGSIERQGEEKDFSFLGSS